MGVRGGCRRHRRRRRLCRGGRLGGQAREGESGDEGRDRPDTVQPARRKPGSPAEGQDPGEVVSHEVNQDPQDAVDYWTDQRMEEAEPMPMPEVNGQLNDVDN
ncbi:hypothetical protein [Nonomuraea recticatena]|uniref:hypothetical protein n=1 Tax=Nonomuraea recticatena TaxID=46178 RepID=UPI003623E313